MVAVRINDLQRRGTEEDESFIIGPMYIFKIHMNWWIDSYSLCPLETAES